MSCISIKSCSYVFFNKFNSLLKLHQRLNKAISFTVQAVAIQLICFGKVLTLQASLNTIEYSG